MADEYGNPTQQDLDEAERRRKQIEEARNEGFKTGSEQKYGIPMYGDADSIGGEAAGRGVASIYYGSSREIGDKAKKYRDIVEGNLEKPSGIANRMTQMSNAEIGRQNAKANMAGVNTSAQNIAARRENMSRAEEAQQAQDRINESIYGKSIGAGISGTESLAAAGAGRAIASKPGVTPQYGGGSFDSIICTELYRQGKITDNDFRKTRLFGASVGREVHAGYITLARPVVSLMRKSEAFSNLWIPWAKSIAKGEINLFNKVMIPVCRFIGSLKVELWLKN